MIDAVFDTVVFVRSLINPYGVWGRLVFAYHHRYRLIVSLPLRDEILEVIERPELTRKFRSLTGLHRAMLESILAHATLVELGAIPAISRDPNDDKVLATAAAAKAAYLVTEDTDLLVLREHAGTSIVSAATFLGILEGMEAQDS